jgi:hypothetical protein
MARLWKRDGAPLRADAQEPGDDGPVPTPSPNIAPVEDHVPGSASADVQMKGKKILENAPEDASTDGVNAAGGQYDESDVNFVGRLLEEEGPNYRPQFYIRSADLGEADDRSTLLDVSASTAPDDAVSRAAGTTDAVSETFDRALDDLGELEI